MNDTQAKVSACLPGGTDTAVLDKWTQRIITTGYDKNQGRWSWVKIQGNESKQGKYITIWIINAYRICQKQVVGGNYTLYMQQYEQQLKEGNPTSTPHSQIIIDLNKFIKEYKSQGEEKVICLNANEEMTKGGDPKRGSIFQLIKDNAMICAHEYLGDVEGTSKASDVRNSPLIYMGREKTV